jgi:hypothetical protein
MSRTFLICTRVQCSTHFAMQCKLFLYANGKAAAKRAELASAATDQVYLMCGTAVSAKAAQECAVDLVNGTQCNSTAVTNM